MSIIDENILCVTLCNPLRTFVVPFYYKGTQSLKERLDVSYKIDNHYVS